MTDTAADSREIAELTIISRPNCSLPVGRRVLFFCIMLVLSMIIAIGFALAGAWLILPFSGLEVFALGWALYYISCHESDYECIVITGSNMVIETRNYKTVHKVEFQRYWVQVVVLPASAKGRCRVWVQASGQEVELGQFVNDEERMALAHQLKLQTGAGFRV
jgi:uncharacterized membrane protein